MKGDGVIAEMKIDTHCQDRSGANLGEAQGIPVGIIHVELARAPATEVQHPRVKVQRRLQISASHGRNDRDAHLGVHSYWNNGRSIRSCRAPRGRSIATVSRLFVSTEQP